MATSLTFYVQLSTFVIQHAACQFPTMFGMQGFPSMSQMGSYPTQIQSSQYYDESYITPEKKKKNKSKRKGKSLRRTMSSCSKSSESDDISEDCSCENCDQCTTPQQPICCQSFCDTCTPNINQGIVFMPYPYPLVITNLQPNNRDNERNDKEKSEGSGDESDKKPDKPEQVDERTTQKEFTKITEKPTTKLVEKTTTEVVSSEIPSGRRKNTNKNQNNETYIDVDVIKILLESQAKKLGQQEQDFSDVVFKVPNKGNNKYVLTSMRRVQQNWMPKYGIVPIPEKVANNLMMKLRSMKVLQAHRDIQALTASPDMDDKTRKKNMLPIELINKIYP